MSYKNIVIEPLKSIKNINYLKNLCKISPPEYFFKKENQNLNESKNRNFSKREKNKNNQFFTQKNFFNNLNKKRYYSSSIKKKNLNKDSYQKKQKSSHFKINKKKNKKFLNLKTPKKKLNKIKLIFSEDLLTQKKIKNFQKRFCFQKNYQIEEIDKSSSSDSEYDINTRERSITLI